MVVYYICAGILMGIGITLLLECFGRYLAHKWWK